MTGHHVSVLSPFPLSDALTRIFLLYNLYLYCAYMLFLSDSSSRVTAVDALCQLPQMSLVLVFNVPSLARLIQYPILLFETDHMQATAS